MPMHVGPNGGPRCFDQQNVQGRRLSELVDRNDLVFTSLSECTQGPTHPLFRGVVQTTTDYIITNAVSAPLVSNCSVQQLHPLNSSDHLPLSISLSMPLESNLKPPTFQRLDWKKASNDGSTAQFATLVNGLLRPQIGKEYTSPCELEQEIESVANEILQAAIATIPQFKPKKP